MEDCLSLGKGIDKSPKLRKFSLTRSNLDRTRVAVILREIKQNPNVSEQVQAISRRLVIAKDQKLFHSAIYWICSSDELSFVSYAQIEELDLSYCKLADIGAHAIGAFLSINQHLRTLRLVNNNVGPSGMAGIIRGILIAKSSALRDLDVRLNPVLDEGANYVCAREYEYLSSYLSHFRFWFHLEQEIWNIDINIRDNQRQLHIF
jgi:hypothetical protein